MKTKSFLIAAALCSAGIATTAQADPQIYDVKVICGKEEGKIAAPGQYWTKINILNPNKETVKVEARMSVALPGLTMGPLSGPVGAELRPDRSMELDCPTLMEMARGPDFLKGFAIVRGSAPLTVVAVYTQANREQQAVSMDVEKVHPRKAAGCGPDLTIKEILRPQWDNVNRQSVIRAVVANIGTDDAPSTIARLIDPSTVQPTGAPYNAIASTGPIPAGGEVMVTFTLPYWVYNPDAELEVTADYKGQLPECDEGNNVLDFNELG